MTDQQQQEPLVSDRGFRRFEPIHGSHNDPFTGAPIQLPETVRVYESSAATGAHLWLAAEDPVVNQPGRATVHLSLESARKLRDQLDWFLAHHYQLGGNA